MSKKAAYERLSIKPKQIAQMKGFTAASQRKTYAGHIRGIKRGLGYKDRAVTIRDKRVIEEIETLAEETAQSILSTVNAMIEKALAKHPEGLTTAEYVDLLQPLFSSFSTYNKKTLVPMDANKARSLAERDFWRNNGLQVQYSFVRQDGTNIEPECDECKQIKSAGNFSQSQVDSMEVPVHPNCFIAGTIVSGPLAHSSFERPYEGPIVTISTASGDVLTGTPNHPILTPEGWVSLGLLKEGSDIYRCANIETLPPILSYPDEYQIPSVIEEVLTAPPMPLLQVPVSPTDFHGDGIAESYVNVVLPYSSLYDYVSRDNTSEHSSQLQLATTRAKSQSLFGLCPRHQLLYRSLLSPDSIVGVVDSLFDAAQDDAAFSHPSTESHGIDADLSRQLVRRFSSRVPLDKVVKVVNEYFCGHVYNLSTSEGWYVANGIIVSNCGDMWKAVGIDPESLPAEEELWDSSRDLAQVKAIRRIRVDPIGATRALVLTAQHHGIYPLRSKFNPYHVPAGSPGGGQFTSGSGGSGPTHVGIGVDANNSDAEWYFDRQKDVASSLGVNSYDMIPALNEKLASMSGLPPSTVEEFIGDWQTSARSHRSVAMNVAIAQKFGIPIDPTTEKRIDALGGINLGVLGTARKFVDAQYQLTQETLAGFGVTNIDLYRGVNYDPTEVADTSPALLSAPTLTARDTQWSSLETTMRPATSWSVSAMDAEWFATHFIYGTGDETLGDFQPYFLHINAPVKDIFSLGFTGVGSDLEHEAVLIGGDRVVNVAKYDVQALRDGIEKGQSWFDEKDVRKFNPYHVPAGSPEGGQFTSSGPSDLSYTSQHNDLIKYRDWTYNAGPEVLQNWARNNISIAMPEHGDSPATIVGFGSLLDGKTKTYQQPLAKQVAERSMLLNPDTKVTTADVEDFARQWNTGAETPHAMALVQAASQKFDLPIDAITQQRLDHARAMVDEPTWKDLQDKASSVVEGQYQYTQDELARLGIDHVDLYRGVHYPYGSDSTQDIADAPTASDLTNVEWKNIDVTTRPLTSWTSNHGTALWFCQLGKMNAGYGREESYIIHERVPASKIFSTGFTGIASPGEQEFLVIGGEHHAHIAHYTSDAWQAWKMFATKYNPYHVPSGSPEGGQFTTGSSTFFNLNDSERKEYHGWASSVGIDPKDALRAEVATSARIAARVPDVNPRRVRDYVELWSISSSVPSSAGLQVAVQEKWNMPSDSVTRGRVDIAKGDMERSGENFETDLMPEARAIADAQYAETQDALKKLGITEVNLYRCVGYSDEQLQSMQELQDVPSLQKEGTSWKHLLSSSRPLTSWAYSPNDALDFAKQARQSGRTPFIIHTRAPASDVFSTGFTGLGSTWETEFVLIGKDRPIDIARVDNPYFTK